MHPPDEAAVENLIALANELTPPSSPPTSRSPSPRGCGPDLYTVTRHYFGWYAFNVLGLPDHVIALHLGHRDGGKLVRTLYCHPDEKIARHRVREAHRMAPPAPIPLRRVTA